MSPFSSLEIKRQRYASCRNPVSTFSPSTTMKSFDSHNRRAPGCLTLLFNREIPTALQAVPQSVSPNLLASSLRATIDNRASPSRGLEIRATSSELPPPPGLQETNWYGIDKP